MNAGDSCSLLSFSSFCHYFDIFSISCMKYSYSSSGIIAVKENVMTNP